MANIVSNIQSLSYQCNCGNQHKIIEIEEIVVEKGALTRAVEFIKKKNYQSIKLIVDENTFKACGEVLSSLLKKEKLSYSVCFVEANENGDIVADETSLIQVLLETSGNEEVMIAVGSGTLHDITRFCSAKMGIPFISIPTAPSVDGFTSLGAPLIVKGVKQTFQLTSPVGVFADIDILSAAPRKMIAAGVGDMVAKYTSLADWKLDSLVTGEPYCPLAVQITQDALQLCTDNIDHIAAGDTKGITILIESLIQSGLAMLLFGQSHPASGGEHHISHFWEMQFLKENRHQVLHGEKVGVATILLATLYKERLLSVLENDSLIKQGDMPEEWKRNLLENKEEVLTIYKEIPNAEQIKGLIQKVSGPISYQDLSIEEELLLNALKEAHHLRNRFTGLKLLSMVGEKEFSTYLSV